MPRMLIAIVVFAIASSTSRPDEKQDAAKKVADSMAAAMVKGDFAKVFDHTWPPLVEALGGKEKATAATEQAMKQAGIVFTEIKFGDATEYLTEGSHGFLTLPTTITMTVPGGTLVAKSYLLGITKDEGKTWAFADGAGIQNPQAREKVLPKLPEKLKLPEPGKPEFTPKK